MGMGLKSTVNVKSKSTTELAVGVCLDVVVWKSVAWRKLLRSR